MNPYDAINHDTQKNNDTKSKKNKQPNPKRTSKNKTSKKSSFKNIKNRNNKIITNHQKKQLKKMYSTDRINMYVLIHLKALQIISGDKSRSNLEEKMIRIVEPKIINSSDKKSKYNKLLRYAIKGIELKQKMN